MNRKDRIIYVIRNLIRCIYARIFKRKSTILVCNGLVENPSGGVIHNNWGDDINVFFIEEATGLKVQYYDNNRIARLIGLKNYVLIGSSFLSRPQRNSTIWGTGADGHPQYFYAEHDIAMGPHLIPSKPSMILAVRGPLTRQWLLDQNIECPDVYGDPALLLPRYYQPKRHLKRYRIGIIPHNFTQKNHMSVVEQFCSRMPMAKLILMHGYDSWKGVINDICDCDLIVSESLHGLIVAAAYGVPATPIEFINHTKGWDFKFIDFYASLTSIDEEKNFNFVKITAETSYELLFSKSRQFANDLIKERTENLLNVCPFDLSPIS